MAAPAIQYDQFIAGKHAAAPAGGFDVADTDLPAKLFAWQRRVVRWALRKGRAALFLDTGLGKSFCQLAWADAVAAFTGKPVLGLCPLAVGPQTVGEAVKFGVPGVELWHEGSAARVQVVNYHKLHLIDTTKYGGVFLDESSILKSFMGKVKRQLCEAFTGTRFRLACTATPAPNDHMELGNHSAFLGVMDADEMLTRWFINDQSQSGVYRLKGHAESDFWRWVASWACCVSKPSDIGGDDAGYDLPPLTIREHFVETELVAAGGHLFDAAKISATTLHREKRKSAAARAGKVNEIVRAEPGESWLVWCDTDYEAAELMKALPAGTVEVAGSMADAAKEAGLAGFSAGTVKALVTKPTVAGFGMNWQHCSRMAFVGLSFSWEQLYQALRRCWRFGQTREVVAHVVCGEGEATILTDIRRKQAANDHMRRAMVDAVRTHWDADHGRPSLTTHQTGRVESGGAWEMRHGDCVQLAREIPDGTVGFSVFSPPFSNLYIYSDSAFDMGNAADDGEFFEHFGYLVPELFRATIPGRLCAVHCKDLPKYMGRDGVAGLKDFPGAVVRLFESHGWTFHSRVLIWKCPVTEMERTKNHGLLHKTVRADSSAVRQGMADYLVVFRKPPTEGLLSDQPVARPNGFRHWPGDPSHDPRESEFHPSKYARKGRHRATISGNAAVVADSIKIWQRLADPVWFHIDQQEVLNYQLGKTDKDEKHICLARDSLVLTAEGHKPIQEVAVGDMVLTHKGRWRPVTAVRMTGVRPCVQLRAHGVPNLVLTPEHKVWTRRAGKTTRARDEAARFTPEWVRADETVGSYVNLQLPPTAGSELTPQEWWLVGRWIADGHKGVRGDFHISVGREKLSEFMERAGEHAGMRHEVTAVQVRLKKLRTQVVEVLNQCGEGAANKRIPACGLSLDAESAAHLLAGYLSGDGHKVPGRERWMASSISRELCLGVAMLAQRVHGVVATVNAGRKPGQAVIEGWTVHTQQEWVVSFDLPHAPGRRKKPFVLDDGAWKKVRSAAAVGERETWCLQVEEDESFTAEGCVVKNCPLQLGVAREAIYLWSNPGDLVLSPFAGIGSEGHEAVKLGRRFLGFELKESYFDLAVKNLTRAEEEAGRRDLFSDFDPEAETVEAVA